MLSRRALALVAIVGSLSACSSDRVSLEVESVRRMGEGDRNFEAMAWVPHHALEPIRVEVDENDQTIEITVTYRKDERPVHPVGPPLTAVAFSLSQALGTRSFVRPDGSVVALT
ncbi:hypothetical protein ACQB6R_00580 [Propionibacteriaceae bacterium G1746]|uniref:hypothetical protein n=1 Tax=Aestuariimicrobium sp. G57 TaxID=3418485 RepID=UPI003C1C9C7F